MLDTVITQVMSVKGVITQVVKEFNNDEHFSEVFRRISFFNEFVSFDFLQVY